MADHAVERHYTNPDLGAAILSALQGMDKDIDRLTPDDLAPVDEFHGGQRPATMRLAELAGLVGNERVLDVGSGLGGPSRFLAWRYGCRVSGVDLTAEFVQIAQMLTRRTGLEDKVDYRQGNALDLPFADRSFDVVWSQNAAMNIQDRGRLYREMRRVLKPRLAGGRRRPGGPAAFPGAMGARAGNQLSLFRHRNAVEARSRRVPRRRLAGHDARSLGRGRAPQAKHCFGAAAARHASDPWRRLAGDVSEFRPQPRRASHRALQCRSCPCGLARPDGDASSVLNQKFIQLQSGGLMRGSGPRMTISLMLPMHYRHRRA
jgi:SAM-dependent methyltransferase